LFNHSAEFFNGLLGYPTNDIQTYSDGSGALKVRTNIYTYAANNIDLLTITNASGTQVSSNAYANQSVVTNYYNALNERTVYTYDSYQRLTSRTLPT